jgi:hypothetical protein
MNTEIQYSHYQSQGIGIVPVIVMLAFAVLMIASMWKVFSKAGKPGWAAIIPIYNIIVLLDIAKKPVWWIVLFLIPVVSLIMSIMVAVGVANNFGKGVGFGLGLAFLSPIFYPILAFGSAQYVDSTTSSGRPMGRAVAY